MEEDLIGAMSCTHELKRMRFSSSLAQGHVRLWPRCAGSANGRFWPTVAGQIVDAEGPKQPSKEEPCNGILWHNELAWSINWSNESVRSQVDRLEVLPTPANSTIAVRSVRAS